jgi:hypothetical protein
MAHTKETLLNAAVETYRAALKQLYICELKQNKSLSEYNEAYYTVRGIEMVLLSMGFNKDQFTPIRDGVFTMVKTLMKIN